MTVSPITRITGGVAGLAATYAEVRALADRFDAAGDHLRDLAAADARVLTEPDLLESAPLSPTTYAEAEGRVLDASTGIHGALEASVAYEADALLVRATVTAYEECDRLVASSFELLDYVVGRDVGYAVSAAAPTLLLLGLVAAPTWDHLPESTRRRLGGTAEEWAEQHPDAVQHGVDASGGLLDGLLGEVRSHRGWPDSPRSIRPRGMRRPTSPRCTARRVHPTYAGATTWRCLSATSRHTT
jgi:hypothetical protein